MSRRTSRNTYPLTALVLIVALLAPAWHTAQASSGEASAGVTARQAVAQQAPTPQAAPPGNLANVPGASAGWWAAVQEQVQQDVFALSESKAEGGALTYVGHNPVHAFDLAFSADGVRLVPAGEAAWSWGLRLAAYGHEGRVQPVVGPPAMTVNGKQLEYRHAGLIEWYVNDERGLEQGFVLESPPPAGEAGQALVLDMALETGLVPALSDDAQSIDFLRADGSAAALRYTGLVVVDAAGRELDAHLSVSPGRISISIDDAGAAYPLLVDPVVLTPDWTVTGDQADARLGSSVAGAGDVNGDGYDDVIVGVPGYDGTYHANAGRAYVYYGSATGPSLSPDWSVEGNWADTWLGASVATAGDVDDDGYDDVAIGAPGAQRGYVYVYLGSASGLSSSPDWTKQVNEAQFGASVGTAGDVNCDGHDDLFILAPTSGQVQVYHGSTYGMLDDVKWSTAGKSAAPVDLGGTGCYSLIIGQPDYTNGQAGEGQALLYRGSSSGLSTTSSWNYESNASGAHFGQSVGAAGDINGDGDAEVIVGAPGYTNGQQGEGRAFVFHIDHSGPPIDPPIWMAESDQEDAAFGQAVGTAGDVNGDGYDDLVIAAPGFDGGQTNEGRVFVYHGAATGLRGIAQWTAESDQDDAAFGQAVGTAGDLNGDGYDDVLVGAPGFDNVQTDEGRAYVFLGSTPVITDYQWSAGGQSAGDELGRSVATAGDVNGDGYSDVVVGAPSNDETGPGAGKVYVYYGSGSGLGLEPAWTALGEAAEDGFGSAVGTAGDVNGDGFDDLVIGAPGHGSGRVYVYYGSAAGLGGVGWMANGQYGGDELGSALGTAGDVNRDGYDDLLVGAAGYPDGSAYGKVYLYHGGANGLGTTAAWAASGQSAGQRFGAAVATAGDVNADGYADAVIGAPLGNKVYVYHGGPGGLAPSAAWTKTGDAGSQFGYAVGMAGDVNGDGYSDIVIGAPMLDPAGLADAGRASGYYGAVGGLSSSPSWSVDGATAGSRLGAAVGTAGDVNGDGYADVVIGAYGTESLAGQIRLYQGSPAGLSLTPDRTASGEAAADRLGLAVRAAGDVNGDGFGDVVAGAPGYDGPGGANAGRATVYHGAADAPSQDEPGWWAYATRAETAGDLNGDGYGDVVVGSELTAKASPITAAGPGYRAWRTGRGQAQPVLAAPWGLQATSTGMGMPTSCCRT